jgi:CRISPR-associated endonuclease/helicase Cas3
VPPPALPSFLAESAEQATARRSHEFWIRMLFSALVDADRLATEAFYEPDKAARRGAYPPLNQVQRSLDAYLGRFAADTDVNVARAEVLADCRHAAPQPAGFFSLTAPTGSGKTLSAMAFALAHAQQHGLRRVIVVVPYTSIIEQNAAAYRDAMGGDALVEHHSNLDEVERERVAPEAEVLRRLATENWDAPVIITTTVQFFESLFSNHPGTCRKLHNIARSVVILDEAQCLPPAYLSPLLDALRELTSHYGCTVVISTATQPALGRRAALPEGLDAVREIVRDPRALAARLERVRVRFPADYRTATPFESLAPELEAHPQVLAVVHRRADARRLAMLLPEQGRFHLSALMCAAHRLEVLGTITARLKERSVCRVVATQLVEAGVDLDFPVVYRALAGLDSLAQAAGRCNREGTIPRGEFVVFRAETEPPPGTLRIALQATEALLAEHSDGLPLSDPALFEQFFRQFFHHSDLDRRAIQPERAVLNFATVAREFRLIEDGYRRAVAVPWGAGPERLRGFEAEPGRDTARGLQPFLVHVPERTAERLLQAGRLRAVSESLLAVAPGWEEIYTEGFGLLVEEEDDAHVSPSPLIV